jgi:hypothetical protein
MSSGAACSQSLSTGFPFSCHLRVRSFTVRAASSRSAKPRTDAPRQHPRPGPFSANAVSEASLVLDHEHGRGATSQHPSRLDPAMSPPKVMTPNSCAVMVDHSPRAHRPASVLISDPREKSRTGHDMQPYANVANRRVAGVIHVATAEGESLSSLQTKQGCVGT